MVPKRLSLDHSEKRVNSECVIVDISTAQCEENIENDEK